MFKCFLTHSSLAVKTTDVLLAVSNKRLITLQDIKTSCQIKEIEASRLNTDLLFPSWIFVLCKGTCKNVPRYLLALHIPFSLRVFLVSSIRDKLSFVILKSTRT